MFGKLVKHEFKATYKIFCLFAAAIAFVTIIGSLILSSDFLTENDVEGIITGGCVLAYFVLLTGILLITVLYLVIRFYKNVYGREGYLTNTLPVKPSEILNSKLIVSTIWMTGIGMLVALSVTILVKIGDSGFEYTGNIDIKELMNSGIIWIAISFFILLVVSNAEKNLSYYFCCSLGQLSNKHKVGDSILAFFVLNAVMGVIANIFSVGIALVGFTNNLSIEAVVNQMRQSLGVTGMLLIFINGLTLGLLILGIIFYALNHYIMKKKLNLE